MSEESLCERWERLGNDCEEYIKFERVRNKRSNRPDLHAFLLLDELFPQSRDIICGAWHDEIALDVSEDDADTLTDEQIVELIRCGVRLGDGGLVMFA